MYGKLEHSRNSVVWGSGGQRGKREGESAFPSTRNATTS